MSGARTIGGGSPVAEGWQGLLGSGEPDVLVNV